MDRNLEKILNNYLQEIEAGLEGVSFAAREEFIAEIRSHLAEKWEQGEVQNRENLLRVIEEFGDPQEIAADYLAKSSVGEKPRGAHPPTWLVIGLTAFIWPVGIVLAWISPAWRSKDKVIATLIPLLALGLLLAGTIYVRTSFFEGFNPKIIYEDTKLEVLENDEY